MCRCTPWLSCTGRRCAPNLKAYLYTTLCRPLCCLPLHPLMGSCFSAAGLESTTSQPLLRGTEPQQYRLAKTPVVPTRASQPASKPAMAASVDRTTLVPGETVTDLVTRFKALIAQETDPAKKAAMEAQLQEKEEAIRNKRYRCVIAWDSPALRFFLGLLPRCAAAVLRRASCFRHPSVVHLQPFGL